MKKLLIFLMPLFLLGACGKTAEVVEEPIKAVKTLTISEASKTNSRQISGIVKTSDESQLSFRVSGKVASVTVKAGDSVIKGQVLATLDQKQYKLAIDSAKAKLNSANADLNQKSENLKRQKNLKQKDFVSQAAVDKAQAEYGTAKANADLAKTALKNTQIDLEDTILKAPFEGKISKRGIEAFTEVSAGKTVFDLQSSDGYKVEVLMPETLVRDVNNGDGVNVSFPTLKNRMVKGTVSEIGAKVEAGNAFSVKIELTNPPTDTRSGMTAQVSFNFGIKEDASVYLIPISALDLRIPEEGDKLVKENAPVFIFNKEKNIAEKRMVTIRGIRGNEFEVINGLDADDILIVTGVPFITDGQSVKQWQPNYDTPAVINLDK